jgi:23S rRNA (guanosine2251-2'-O)-methyltransferase
MAPPNRRPRRPERHPPRRGAAPERGSEARDRDGSSPQDRNRPHASEGHPASRGERPGSRERHAPRQRPASHPRPSGTNPGPQRRPGTHYLYGINPIARALEVGRRKLFRLWLREGRRSEVLEALYVAMVAHGLPVSEADGDELEALAASGSHQGAVLECGPLTLGTEDEALALLDGSVGDGGTPSASTDAAPNAARSPLPLLVVLDQVEDPQNFGAIVRSCAVFGASGVVVPRHHAAPPSPAASKASAGEIEAYSVFEAANLSRFLEACKARGAWTAAAVAEGGQALDGFTRDTPLVLVVGNEGRGLRPLVERHCDFRLTIPVQAGSSLNVSAATAVLLYALTRGKG